MNVYEPASSILHTSTEPLQPLRRERKWPISYRSVSLMAISADAFTILLSGVLSGVLYNWNTLLPGDTLHYFGSAAVVAALFICVMKAQDLYSPADFLAFRTQALATFATWFSVFLFLSGAAFALKMGAEFSRVAVFIFGVIGLMLLLVQRLFYRALVRRGLATHKFAGRNAILITDEATGNGEALVQRCSSIASAWIVNLSCLMRIAPPRTWKILWPTSRTMSEAHLSTKLFWASAQIVGAI